MLRYLQNRLISFIASVVSASLLIFILIEGVPGDPASFMLGINATEETVSALRTELGISEHLLTRYFDWVFGMMTGNFGISYTYRVPVAELIFERISLSLPLAIFFP